VHAIVTYGRGVVLLWQRCDKSCTSGLMDIIFFYNGPCGTGDAARVWLSDSPKAAQISDRNVYLKKETTGHWGRM